MCFLLLELYELPNLIIFWQNQGFTVKNSKFLKLLEKHDTEEKKKKKSSLMILIQKQNLEMISPSNF